MQNCNGICFIKLYPFILYPRIFSMLHEYLRSSGAPSRVAVPRPRNAVWHLALYQRQLSDSDREYCSSSKRQNHDSIVRVIEENLNPFPLDLFFDHDPVHSTPSYHYYNYTMPSTRRCVFAGMWFPLF